MARFLSKRALTSDSPLAVSAQSQVDMAELPSYYSELLPACGCAHTTDSHKLCVASEISNLLAKSQGL